MVKGDIIAGSLGATATFTPASGVEIIITCVTNIANALTYWGLGGDDYFLVVAADTANVGNSNLRVGITNAIGLYTLSGGSYSGVQVK